MLSLSMRIFRNIIDCLPRFISTDTRHGPQEQKGCIGLCPEKTWAGRVTNPQWWAHSCTQHGGLACRVCDHWMPPAWSNQQCTQHDDHTSLSYNQTQKSDWHFDGCWMTHSIFSSKLSCSAITPEMWHRSIGAVNLNMLHIHKLWAALPSSPDLCCLWVFVIPEWSNNRFGNVWQPPLA